MLSRSSHVLSLALAALTIFRAGADALAVGKQHDESHWVSAWTSMPQLVEPNNMPPSQFV